MSLSPEVTLSASPTSGAGPLLVTLTGAWIGASGTVTWIMNFGDGSTPSTGTSTSPTGTITIIHNYASGSFQPSFTASTPAQGLLGSANLQINLTPLPAPVGPAVADYVIYKSGSTYIAQAQAGIGLSSAARTDSDLGALLNSVFAPGRSHYITSGIWTVKTPLTPAANDMIFGAGLEATLLQFALQSTDDHAIIDGVGANFSTVRDLTLDANKAVQTQPHIHGLRFDNSSDCTVFNVEAKNSASPNGNGIVFRNGSNRGWIKANCNNNAADGIYLENTQDCFVTGDYYANGLNGVDIAQTTGTSKGNIVSANIINNVGAASYGVNIDSSSENVVEACSMTNNRRHVALFKTNANALNNSIIGNRLLAPIEWCLTEAATGIDFNTILNNRVGAGTSGTFFLKGNNTRPIGNFGYNPIGNITAPFDNTAFVIGITAANTPAALPTSLLNDYTVVNTDLMITDTAANGGTITLKDPAGTIITAGFNSATSALYCPVGYKLRFVTALPTAIAVAGN